MCVVVYSGVLCMRGCVHRGMYVCISVCERECVCVVVYSDVTVLVRSNFQKFSREALREDLFFCLL